MTLAFCISSIAFRKSLIYSGLLITLNFTCPASVLPVNDIEITVTGRVGQGDVCNLDTLYLSASH